MGERYVISHEPNSFDGLTWRAPKELGKATVALLGGTILDRFITGGSVVGDVLLGAGGVTGLLTLGATGVKLLKDNFDVEYRLDPSEGIAGLHSGIRPKQGGSNE